MEDPSSVLATPSRLAGPGSRRHGVPGTTQASSTGGQVVNKHHDNSPPSDDSISAYINQSTSSPPDTHHEHNPQHLNSRSTVRRDADLATTRSLGRTEQQRNDGEEDDERPPSSPSPTPADEEDVAAASGMLSLRASQDLSASGVRDAGVSAWSHRAQGIANRSSPSQTTFIIHQDESSRDQDADGSASAAPASLSSAILNDALLFQRTSSQSSLLEFARRSLESRHQDLKGDELGCEIQDNRVEAGDDEADDSQLGGSSQNVNGDDSAEVSLNDSREEADVDSKGKKRRRRTKKEEADVLVKVYAQTAFPDAVTRQKLADQLGMTTRAISIWFQNRRQAERKRASRFGPTDVSLQSSRPSTSVPRSQSLNLSRNPTEAAQLQRWPSLDIIAAQQKSQIRDDGGSDAEDSPAEDDAFTALLPAKRILSQSHVDADVFSQPVSSSQTSVKTFDVFEDKENVPLDNSQASNDSLTSQDQKAEGAQGRRAPLRDIRDLVSGREALRDIEGEEHSSLSKQPEEDAVCGSKAAVLAEDRGGSLAPLSSSEPLRTRLPLDRSLSGNALTKPRVSMDQVVSRLVPHKGPTSPRRRAGGMLRVMSLSTSRRGRASLDGKPSPPRKRPFARSLSLSSNLPPALVKLIQEQEMADGQSKALEQNKSSQQGLLAKMCSSSSTSSGEERASNRARLLDQDEDEERTLRMAANRRIAKAQAQGRPLLDKADALSDLITRPWARSVSGPAGSAKGNTSGNAGRMGAPSLDLAAGRDRSKPNLFQSVRSLSLHSLHHLKEARADSPRSVSSAMSAPQQHGQVVAAAKKHGRKRKSQEEHKSRKAAETSSDLVGGAHARENAAAAAVSQDSSIIPMQSTPVGEKTARGVKTTPKGLPSFGTPRSGLASSRRPFGRSVSAQTNVGPMHSLAFGCEDTISSPMARPLLPSSYVANTPAGPPRHSGAPSAAMASASREMTPHSLAFALGLTYNNPSGMSQQTPYGGMGATPFGHSSRYSTSRFPPPSSARPQYEGLSSMMSVGRGGGQSAMDRGTVPYSPLARGREGAMLAPMSISVHSHSQSTAKAGPGKRKSPDDDSNSGGSSEGHGHNGKSDHSRQGVPFSAPRSRLPFAKVNSQPALSGSPGFASAASPVGHARHPEQVRRTRLPSLSSLATYAHDKENNMAARPSPVRGNVDKPIEMLAGNEAEAANDSGYVGASDDEDALHGNGRDASSGLASKQAGVRKGRASMESPTRVQQQRQRQHDAAQVLLGLAGEGR